MDRVTEYCLSPGLQRRMRTTILFCLWFLFSSAVAHAELVRLDFQATVVSISNPTQPRIVNVGDPIHGHLIYTTDTTGMNIVTTTTPNFARTQYGDAVSPTPPVPSFIGPIKEAQIFVNSILMTNFTPATQFVNVIDVQDGFVGGTDPREDFVVFNFKDTDDIGHSGVDFTLRFEGENKSGTVLNSTALPSPFPASGWQFPPHPGGIIATSSLNGPNTLNSESTGQFHANFTSLNVTAVPLPPAAILFGTGFIGLLGVFRRSRVF